MRIRDVMSSPVVAVTADASPAEAAAVMREHGFTTLPVLDDHGNLLGLVTEADLARSYFASQAGRGSTPEDGVLLAGERTVADLMDPRAAMVGPDDEVPVVAAVMLEAGRRCVPVVAGGHVVGIVSWRDLVALLIQSRP